MTSGASDPGGVEATQSNTSEATITIGTGGMM